MNIRKRYNILRILIGLSIGLFSNVTYADPPLDSYQVKYEDISKQVLKDAIGIISIYKEELPIYTQTTKGFISEHIIEFAQDTLPISMQGYSGGDAILTKQEYQALIQAVPAFRQAHEGIQIEEDQATVAANINREWVEANAANLGKKYYYLLKKALRIAVDRNHDDGYRYPILAQYQEYLQIVSDPLTNQTIWINRADIPEYNHSIIMFDAIYDNQGWFFDLFYLVNGQERILYTRPNTTSKKTILRSQDYPFQTFQITEQKNGFAKIIHVHDIGETQELGWLKIRNEEGEITLWIVYIDMC